MQVDHGCGNTLCVQHLASMPPAANRELQWIRVQVGLDPPPVAPAIDDDGVPFFWPPEWLTLPPDGPSHMQAQWPTNATQG